MEDIEKKFLSIFQNTSFPNLMKLSDGILYTEDSCKFHIHRSILAIKSEYFHALVTGLDSDRTEFSIPDISGVCLCDILVFLYTGDVLVTSSNISELLLGADYLLVRDMFIKIKQNVKACMTEDNCLKILHTAYTIGDQDIMKKSIRFIEIRFEKIIADYYTELQNIPVNILCKILRSPSLYVYNEGTVWEVIVQWTQKNANDRLSYVSQLLLSLAIEEVDENLATEILHHEIVCNNPYMVDLKRTNSSNKYDNRDILLQFIQNYSDDSRVPCYHRIPQKLFVFKVSRCQSLPHLPPNTLQENGLYITYDGNTDLCYKISEADSFVPFITVIGQNIFILGRKNWVKFNLISMDWIPMENFRIGKTEEFFIVAIELSIYVLFQPDPEDDEDTYHLKIYDTESNVWFDGVSVHNIYISHAVAIANGILVLGYDVEFEMIMQRFDVITRKWDLLPPPNHKYSDISVAAAFRNKLYLVGKGIGIKQNNGLTLNAEVFDPETAIWKVLPVFPYECSHFHATVLNDLFIYGNSGESAVSARWDELNESWEKTESLGVLTSLHPSFCSIEDGNLIRIITKRIRDPRNMTRERFILLQ